MGESITEGTLTKWLKKPGDTVARDEPLFEISTDKVDAEIPSPAAGVLGAIKVEEGATVTVGTVVCAIEEAGSAPAAAAPAAPKAESVTPAAATTAAADAAVAPPAPEALGTGTDVVMPQMGESITEGTLTKWLKKVGDTVARDEPIFEISTDKVDAEIPSPVAGTLTAIKVEEGQTVTVGTLVAVIGRRSSGPEGSTRSRSANTGCRSGTCGTSTCRLCIHGRGSALFAAGPQDREREPRRSDDRPRAPALRAASPSTTSSAIWKEHPLLLLPHQLLLHPLLLHPRRHLLR